LIFYYFQEQYSRSYFVCRLVCATRTGINSRSRQQWMDTATPVPEPEAYAMMLVGLGM